MSNENNEINVTEQPKHHKKKKRKHIEIRLDIKTNIMLIVITVLLIIIGTMGLFLFNPDYRDFFNISHLYLCR